MDLIPHLLNGRIYNRHCGEKGFLKAFTILKLTSILDQGWSQPPLGFYSYLLCHCH